MSKEYTHLSREDLTALFSFLAESGFLVLRKDTTGEEYCKWKDPKFIPTLCTYDPIPKDKVHYIATSLIPDI
jgi:hypothetical protein